MLEPQPPPDADFQGGVFTRRQAYAAGHSTRQVRRWLELGKWKVVAGAAIGPAGLNVGPEQLSHSVLLSWSAAVISHECAGALHGFPVDPHGIGTAIVEPHRGLVAHNLRAHRMPLSQRAVVWRAGIPLTDRRRTAIDLLATLGWDDCRDLTAWLVTRRIITSDHLDQALDAMAGRPGARQVRRLAALVRRGSLSAGEDLLHEVLVEMRLTGWVANAPISVGGRIVAVVDVLVENCRLVLQVDGWRAHGGRASFQRDRTQQNLLVSAGYVVLRFTWADLTERRAQVERTIRLAVERASP
ncbi:MAG: endonuclease domain-containing protein [Actinomycetales bacterium]